jgi:hypothetical protein
MVSFTPIRYGSLSLEGIKENLCIPMPLSSGLRVEAVGRDGIIRYGM